MKPSEYLRQGWCQCAYAVNQKGWRVDSVSDKAIRWCMVGSAYRAYFKGEINYSQIHDLLSTLRTLIAGTEDPQGIGSGIISHWNDDPDRTEEEVIALMEQAEALVWDRPGQQ